jgi:pyruvate formate lyase activating enzyme
MVNQHPDFHVPISGKRLLCTLCPRACTLSEGQRGLCFVRQRQGDHIKLTSYGRSSGFVIDPIEKKPLNHFYPGSSVLSFGTAGCNLSCKFCQNWDMSKSRQMDILQSPASSEAIAAAATLHGCKSVAFTYNDPVIFYEYAVDTAMACHEQDIKTVAVTAGYIGELARPGFFEHIDAANVDLKGFNDRFYQELCGGELQPVLDTLKYLVHETDVWTEVTTLLIPGENDSDEELKAQCKWIANELGLDIPVHFSAFHPDFKLTTHPPTPLKTLQRAKQIAMQAGLIHVYLGNVHDPDNTSTTCAKCQKLLIGRSAYSITAWGLNTEGCCQQCGESLRGIFANEPGQWGNRYERIRI